MLHRSILLVTHSRVVLLQGTEEVLVPGSEGRLPYFKFENEVVKKA